MTGTKRGDYPIREGLEKKMTKCSKDDTTPAATAIGIVRLSTSAISSWRITTRTRHCGTTTLLFLKDQIRIVVIPATSSKPYYTSVSRGQGWWRLRRRWFAAWQRFRWICTRNVWRDHVPLMQWLWQGEREQITCTVHANLALIFQVTLVCDNDDREVILVLDAQDWLMKRANFLEWITRRNWIDE